MKRICVAVILIVAITLAFFIIKNKGCFASKPIILDEKAALAKFKGDTEDAVRWIDEQKKAAGSDVTGGVARIGRLVEMLKGIKTDGLPEDLKVAWSDMGVALKEMCDILKTLPKPDLANSMPSSAALRELNPKIMAIQSKVLPATRNLREVASKYGIDVSKLSPLRE